MTSKYIISNMVIQPIFPIRKCQIFVNTHHGGGAYKRSSWHIPAYKKRAFSMRVMNKIRNGMTAYLISSCREFNFAALDLWDLPGNKILPIGMPRNDIFFSDINPIKEKVTRYLNMNNNIKKIILYAPTFRGIHNDVEEFKYQLDIGSILLALKERFNDDFIFLYRSHHLFHNNVNNQELQGCVSVSEYQEMQELLCAADVLITDYSSCMWDFSFTHKPCFIYAPDLIKYTEVQGFYTPIEKWPFPVAETNERLVYNILHFDEEKYRNDVKQHHLDLGSFETGTASKQFCKILFGNGEI
jgi:CDP-glycerol glycerophosphotransferase